MSIEPVQRVEVRVLVDNTTDGLSSNPDFVETELTSLRNRRQGAWMMNGGSLSSPAHGLSCLVTIRDAGQSRAVLFDAGPEDRVFEQNVTRQGVDLSEVEAIVLSHGHWDHAAGMLKAVQMVRDRTGGGEVPYFAHPDMFRSRAGRQRDGMMRLIEDVPSIAALTAHGARVVNTTEPQALLDGRAYLSGEIPRVTPFEVGLPGQHRRTLDGQGWEPDELLMDERFLAVHLAGKGIVVLSGCSHAGIVNVLLAAQAQFPGVPLYAVFGGLHLSGTNERVIPETVQALHALQPAIFAPGHCTGWRAVSALVEAFGSSSMVPLAVGKRYTL